MHRCLTLAREGSGRVAPNPLVGAVLVHEGRIIGEGYHRAYGEPHAEVNCIASVREKDISLIPQSTLYVSLEPCAHYGKTPPCADLIVRHRIPRVVIACSDPFEAVNGRGIQKLRAAGIDVENRVLEAEARALNRRFFRFHEQKRPYIILKWAQTSNGMIGSADGSRLLISGSDTNRLVHRWRSEEAAILVGTNTVLSDDPQLTNRLWSGPSPVRLVLDMNLRLPAGLKIFDGRVRTILINAKKQGIEAGVEYEQIDPSGNLPREIASLLVRLQLQSVLVEGGARLIQSFIDEGLWDEARLIRNPSLVSAPGVPAPWLREAVLQASEQGQADTIDYYENPRAVTEPGGTFPPMPAR